MTSEKPVVLASFDEEDKVARRLMVWLNEFPDLPVNIDIIRYEQLPDDAVCMAMSAIQSTFITRRYITGGHKAEYQFKVIYRIKPGTSNNARLEADELLDRLGAWAMQNSPNLGDGISSAKVTPTTRSAVFAAYENGDEDHQILMTLTYEVI